jgi:hypothetical protein
MTYILAWLLCSVCSFYLLKTYITSSLSRLPSPPENIAQAMRNAAKRDDSIDELYNVPDNVICAAFWTILLVESLLIWPINLVILLWWQLFDKQDFSDFRGVE